MIEKPLITYDYDEEYDTVEIYANLRPVASSWCGGIDDIEDHVRNITDAFMAGFDYAQSIIEGK